MVMVKEFIKLVGNVSLYDKVMLEDFFITLDSDEQLRYIDKLKTDKNFDIFSDVFFQHFIEMVEYDRVYKDYS